MYAVGRIGSFISRGVYTVSGPFHPFGGVVDIIVVEQPDGSFKSSPWYVRFGKFQGVLKSKEKVVNISVNEVDANFHMYLDHKGEAYFLREVDEKEEGDSVLCPLSSGDDMEGQSNSSRRPMKSKSYNFDANKSNSLDSIDLSNEKIVARTSSRHSRILGHVFGRRSIKEDNYREEEDNAGIVRVTSMERAEIAADLLEVNWSTNLAYCKRKKDNSSQFSARAMLNVMGDKDIQNNDEQSQVDSSVHDHIENSADHCMLQDKTGFSNEQTGNSSKSGFVDMGCFVQDDTVEMSCISTAEQVFKISTIDDRGMEENFHIISELSKDFDMCSMESANHNDKAEGNISEITAPDLQIPCNHEVCPCELFDEKQACSERVNEGSGSDRDPSFVCSETAGSSMLGLEGSNEQTCETLYLSSGGRDEVHVLAETLYATTEQLFEDTNIEQAEDIKLKMPHVEVSESNYQQTNPFPCIHDFNQMDLKEPVTISESYIYMDSINSTLGSVDQVESQNICAISNFSNSVHQVEEAENHRNGLKPYSLNPVGDLRSSYDDFVPAIAASIPSSESSEEEQFLFTDLDEIKLEEVQRMDSISSDCKIKNNHHLYSLESIEELKESDESYSPPDFFFQYNPPTDLEISMGKSRIISSSIKNSSSIKVSSEEVKMLGGSLPNMRSHVDNLDADSHEHPLSRSLDSASKLSKWPLLGKDELFCKNSDADKGNNLALEQPNNEDTQFPGELESVFVNPALVFYAEISLCKHLLYEIRADAASQAFDTNKLDIGKFDLGSTVVKNDMLVVKIGGRHFPWEVTVPIILWMVTFGYQEILESKAMIAVDQVEQSFEGNISKVVVSPGGSWNLWPFSFKRSRSRKAMQLPPSDARSSDAENASESTIVMVGDKNVLHSKVVKKTVRAKTPTSEQIASLNLKEGRNTVTFTFSTAMLGRQQVDARIYLWKWNTRIVISDVDGTITKSDVLGQFMPMVGVDWTQTGVTHLFSSIKENGYQLLFLSARAISQAYHTRQFLINLKQNGKALPDGPVVISPDGLIPSLYREVIRRAPHEFKIACLEDIKALFPPDCSPFYAGFGNRDTDEISYLKVGIPKGKIFIINPKGQVAVNRRVDTKSYHSLHDLVHGMFPPMTSSEQEDFNSWNYWKLPPLVFDI
ncbi:LOW QUALITY PROTEIN: Lipin_N domain-containing protein/LNS2 domain-containing protein [Cephalotus follicularis]|uniref:phosphatidate phosphatase n=1 Tax=Cephalotus follicularis TaxID=3775 RepID=A0A1Q3D786_CEPFO|nr:LOW QUALITY PROTEIN: Lipin_N domain-containing protein/LNS2 domain-containing protein [Cephalotus follicularis]